MTAISADMTSTQDYVPLSASDAASVAAGLYLIDTEVVEITDQPHLIGSTKASPRTKDGRMAVRGVAGSTAATHSSSATITQYQPDAIPTLTQVLNAGSDTGGALFSTNAGVPGSSFVTPIRLDSTNKLLYVWNGTSYTKVADYA